jgi:hypothetical protein
VIDERICGQRSPEGISCILLPDHPVTRHAGLTASCQVIMWPKADDPYQPEHALREGE